MKINKLLMVVLAGALSALAATDTKNNQTTKTGTDWTQTITVPKFNPNLGTLNSVTITFKCDVEGVLRSENTGGSPANITGTLAATCSEGNTLLQVNPSTGTTFAATAYDNVFDFGGTSGYTSVTLSDSKTSTSGPITSNLPSFTGPGDLSFTITAAGTSSNTGSGNLASNNTTVAQGFITVVYDYTAPATPSVIKSFSVSTTEINKDVAMTITITNTDAGYTLTGLTIEDTPPAGMVFNALVAPTTTCTSGSVSFGTPNLPTTNNTTLTLIGGILGPNSSCTITATVQLTQAGTFTNTTGNVCANSGCGSDASATLTGTNPPPPPPPPPGLQGCSPGFWRNADVSRWFGFTPTSTVASAFSSVTTAFPSIANQTFATVLATTGNANTPQQAAVHLLRSGVAGLLNINNPNVNYPRTSAELQGQVNAALATGVRTTMVAVQGSIEADNTLGCPISNK